MSRQVTDAPAKEMAIGRKIIDLAKASPRRSRSASVAKASPMLTEASGTRIIHPSVLRIERSMASSVKTNRKLARPTNSSPRRSWKLIRIVLITG
jgi:hypothetical protein